MQTPCRIPCGDDACASASAQDFAAGTEAGIGEFCAEAAGAFFAPSNQLYLFVLSKTR
jgi:hypothetical protein